MKIFLILEFLIRQVLGWKFARSSWSTRVPSDLPSNRKMIVAILSINRNRSYFRILIQFEALSWTPKVASVYSTD